MRHLFIQIILALIVLTSNGQDWNAVFSYEIDAEYFIAEGNFDKAAESYSKALDKVPNSSNLKFKAGFCYLKTEVHKDKAMVYLHDAAQNIDENYDSRALRELKAPPEAMYHLGVAYMHEKLFDLAIDCFNKYKGMYKGADSYAIALVEHRIKNCERAKLVFNNYFDYLIESNRVGINNDISNFNAVISGDGNTLAFTSRGDLGNQIYISKLENGAWSTPVDITRRLGSKILRTSFISYDGTELFLVEEDFNGARLTFSKFEKNKWSKVSEFPKPISSKFNEGHVCATKDGNTIYFTSDRKGSLGGFDIYKSVKENDKWGKPQNLGDRINTVLDEKTPFLTDDEKYLFFSSEGHDGIGGQDIYYVDLQSSEQKVVNIGAPLNTPDDDIFFYPKSLSQGYYSQVRADEKNLIDVFTVELIPLYDAKINIRLADSNAQDKNYAVSVSNKVNNNLINETIGKGANNISLRVPAGTYTIEASGADIEHAFAELQIPKGSDSKNFEKTLLINAVKVIEQPIAEVIEVANPDVVEQKNAEENKAIKVEEPEIKPQEPVKNVVEEEVVLIKQESKPETKPKKAKPEVKPKKAKTEKKNNRNNKPAVETKTKATTEVKVGGPIMNFDVSHDKTEAKPSTYSVQLFASEHPADIQHISCFDSVDVTISPKGYYRYSVGETDDVKIVETWLRSVKANGFKDAYVRINREHAGYTIQIMALSAPKSLSYFSNISGVMVSRSVKGIYRYCVGKYVTKEEAQLQVAKLHELGYSDAFVREL